MSFSLTPAVRTASLWSEFWNAEIITGTTINHIKPPYTGFPSFAVIILCIALAAFLVLVLVKRRYSNLAGPLVLASVFAGLLFAIRMDYNWLRVFASDLQRYSGRDIAERVVMTEGHDSYYFMEYVRKNLPEGEKVRSLEIDPKEPGHFFNKLGNYYLLPTLASKDGGFIWVNERIKGSYDPASETLSLYGRSFRAVPYALYRPNAVVYRITGDMK
jgi:hypothetical protein